MQQHRRRRLPTLFPFTAGTAGTAGLVGLAGLCLAACGELEEALGLDDDDSRPARPRPFSPQPTHQAAELGATPVIEGRWLLFLALESTTGKQGTDFNGDGDFRDRIPVIVDMNSRKQRVLHVAAEGGVILGDEIFLSVDEVVDEGDWNLDGFTDDRVLLHWSRATNALVFVCTLATTGTTPILSASDRLYFADDPPALTGTEATIGYVTRAQPTLPVRVLNADPATSPELRLLAADEGLLFLYQDETLVGSDQNGDGDASDEFVLALLDTTDPAALIRNTQLALEDARTPVRARNTGPNDWLVGFLVNEEAQGATNLNAPALFPAAWQPPQCVGLGDTDTDEDVLHFLSFAAWSANPTTSPPVNTGLPGVDRVLAVRGVGGAPGYVATITDEFEEGGCSLNGDEQDDGSGNMVPDQNDRVFRWVQAAVPVLPVTDVDLLLATRNARGGIAGVTELDDRLVIVASEAEDGRDLNGDGKNNNLVAWIDANAGAGATWDLDHSAGSGFFVGTSWMSVDEDHTRLLLSIQETVLGIPFNSGDGDTTDAVPSLSSFDPANPDDLDFPGPPVAADANDSGVVAAGEFLFYRVHECQDGRDWNRDKDTRDVVLCRSKVAELGESRYIVTLTQDLSQSDTNCASVLGAPPLVELYTGGDVGAAFLANEARDRKDYNRDGDRDDFVVHWFRL